MATSKSKKTTETAEEQKPEVKKVTKPKVVTKKLVEKEPLGQYYKNVSAYIHYITDLGLVFYPNETKNLSFEPEKNIKGSVDLKRSLSSNIIKQLSLSEYETESKILR